VSITTKRSIPSIPGLFLTVGSVVSLRDTLQELLDVKPPKNPSWAKDLASLQDQIRQIGIGAKTEEAAEKMLGSIGKGSANRTPDDSQSSDILEQGVRGALKKILNPPTKVALTDAGDEKVIDLIQEFCEGFLKKDSEIIQVFKEPFELIYFGDRYTGKVRKRVNFRQYCVHPFNLEQRAIVRCLALLSESLRILFCHASSMFLSRNVSTV
jgi:hypothetical protein